MSDYVLSSRFKAKMDEQIETHRRYLSDRTQDTESQMRLNQGIVQGLKMAIDLFQETIRE